MQIRMMTAEVEEIVKSLLRIAPPHKTFAPPVFFCLFFLFFFVQNGTQTSQVMFTRFF